MLVIKYRIEEISIQDKGYSFVRTNNLRKILHYLHKVKSA